MHTKHRKTPRGLAWLLVTTLTVTAGIDAREEAVASCNLIPGSRLSFTGTVGSVNRPFSGPAEHVEIDLGIPAPSGEYVVSVFFKGDATTATHLAVLTDADLTGCSALCSSPPASAGYGDSCAIDLVTPPVSSASRCVELDDTGLDFNIFDGSTFLAFQFPDMADTGLFGASVAGPAAIAVTEATNDLPDLSADQCTSLTGAVACVDTISGDDVFTHFTALPAPNDFAVQCTGDSPPCVPALGDIDVAFDDRGNVLVPWNWSGVLVRHEGRPIPRLVNAELKLPFTVPSDEYLASYSPEGGLLAPIFEPALAPSAATTIQLFGSADAPYTILRIARGASGSASSGPEACLASLYDPAVAFPGSEAGGVALANDGTAGCSGAAPRVCQLESGIPVSLQPAALSELIRAHLVDERIDRVERNADVDVLDYGIVLQSRRTGVMQDLGRPAECMTFPPGAEARAPGMVEEPVFVDPMNPPSVTVRFAAAAAEGALLAVLESEDGESCEINGTGAATDHVLRAYELGAGALPTELTLLTGACPVTGTAGAAAVITPVIDDKALAISDGQIFFRGFASGTTGTGPLTMQVFNPKGCTTTDLGIVQAASVAGGKAGLLKPPAVMGAAELHHFSPSLGSVDLARHALKVSHTDRWMATLVSEAADAIDDNGDTDQTDTVARVYDTATGSFNAIARASNAVVAEGDFVVMATLEGNESSTDLNADTDTLDRVLEAYRANCPSGPSSACLVTTDRPAVDFFEVGSEATADCGLVQLVAFSVPEADEGGLDRNSDGDTLDGVLQVLDLMSGVSVNVGRSVIPCTFAECDPRHALTIDGGSVTFLTDEAQEGRDLTGDGTADETVVSIYDFCTGELTSVGSTSATFGFDNCADDVERLPGGVGAVEDDRDPTEPGTSVVVVSDAGRCAIPAPCGIGQPCPSGAFCDMDTCCPVTNTCVAHPDFPCVTDADCNFCELNSPGTCRIGPCGQDRDCPTGSTCIRTPVVVVTDSANPAGSTTTNSSGSGALSPLCLGKDYDCMAGSGDVDSQCSARLAKEFASVARAADKLSIKCHKRRNGDPDLVDVNCNRVADFDPKDKLGRAIGKLVTKTTLACPDLNFTGDGIVCPTPCAGTGAVGEPLVDIADVSACLGCMAKTMIETRNERILGSPTAPMSDPASQLCHETIAKRYAKHLRAVLKDRDECEPGALSCSAAPTNPRVIKALAKAQAKVALACAAVPDVGALDSCALTVDEINECASELSRPCGPSPWCLKTCTQQSTATSTTTTTSICSTTTTLPGDKVVFVTSATTSGDFPGTAAADTICQQAADNALLPGTYAAWICDNQNAPNDVFSKAGGPYFRTDGALVANDWNDLTDGTLANPINFDEFGNDLAAAAPSTAWTLVATNGTCDNVTYPSTGFGPCPPLSNCLADCSNSPGTPGSGWTDQTGNTSGAVGSINETNGQWTTTAAPLACSGDARLYCVQQ